MKDIQHDFIPQKLKQIRIAARLTQKQLAKKLNISRSCLANYETGKRFPNNEILTDIANFFNVEKKYFFKGDVSFLSQVETDYIADNALKEITETGKLDLSRFSLSSKMALYEYYNYLLEQESHKTSQLIS